MQTVTLPTRKLKVLSVFGTRPEAIKMAPVVKGLEAEASWIESKVCVTAQHRQMLDQVLQLFGITPDFDLDLMKPNQDLFHITTAVLNGMKPILETEKPDMVLVHGDTTTSFATSLACYYLQIPVGHVEAGLRTYNSQFPFPEELNRVVTDAIGTLFFAPTEQSKQNLLALRGGNPKGIFVTGNTVIDALFQTLNAPVKVPSPVTLKAGNRLVLATVHRRENFGEPLQAILKALLHLLEQFPDVELALPVHPNPNVKPLVEATLGKHERIHLLAPQEYEPFCRLMQQACLILTDSGGVQEEAPSLGIPVLVLRDETERPEAVEAGTVKLVGPHYEQIVAEAGKLLGDATYYQAMQRASNPYGDGQAVRRIVEALRGFWESVG
jgi:UDP-N-acetylglucosamine 2-epimerase (non-hydrolysing)